MDVSERAQRMMNGNLEAMLVPAVEQQLDQLAKEAVEFLPECHDCPRKHPQPMVFQEEKKNGITHRVTVLLLPSGRLAVTREKMMDGSPIVRGHTQPASVQTIVDAGFEVRQVINGIYLFVEQEKIFRMCGGVKPALA